MDTVTLKPLFHKDQNCIGIYFEHKFILNGAIQKYAGAKWSNSNKCWYVPCTQKNYTLLSNAPANKAMIMLAYSGGLRVSEDVNLRTNFIDSKRMVILIKEAKGKKDRVVSMSPVLLVMLRYNKAG